MNDVYSLDEAIDFTGKNIFLDANILFFVDGLIGQNARTPKYSKLYFEFSKKNKYYTNEYVIGEYCNRMLRYNFAIEEPESTSSSDFKKFRESEIGQEILQGIDDAVYHYLNDATLLSIGETGFPLDEVRSDVTTGKLDFTDALISNVCLANDMILFTDDSDFMCKRHLPLITENPWVLRNRKKRNKLVAC